MHFIYMHDITALHNLLQFNDGLHFYSWWMHNEQSLGLVIRLKSMCLFVEGGHVREWNFGVLQGEESHLKNKNLWDYEILCRGSTFLFMEGRFILPNISLSNPILPFTSHLTYLFLT